jgi:hypothetical protein
MDERVAFFKLDNAALDDRPAAKSIAAAPSRRPAAAPKKQPVAAPKRVAAGANGSGPVAACRPPSLPPSIQIRTGKSSSRNGKRFTAKS